MDLFIVIVRCVMQHVYSSHVQKKERLMKMMNEVTSQRDAQVDIISTRDTEILTLQSRLAGHAHLSSFSLSLSVCLSVCLSVYP